MTASITHKRVSGAAANPKVLVDGPAWDDTHAISGQIPLSNGGTGADLSASGGASQVLTQQSPGGAVTVQRLVFTDLASPSTGGTSQVLKQATAGGPISVGQLQFSDIAGTIGNGQFPFQNFDTRAAAIAANVLGSVNSLILSGYSAAGDGGRAQYKRLGSAPSPVKAWHFQSADSAWWQLAETTVNPKQLGAVANGATDDGAVLQAMNDYLSTVWGGGTFYMPPGINCAAATQNISLSAGVIVRGDGTITRTTVGAGPVFTSTANGVDIQDVNIIWGAGSNGVNNSDNAIFISGSINPVVRNTVIKGAFYIGVEAFKCASTMIDGNHIAGHVNRGVYIVSDVTGVATYNTVSDNTIDGYQLSTTTRLANYGINCNSSNTTTASPNLVVIGNQVRNTKNHGIGVAGFWTNTIVGDNSVDNIQDGAGGGVSILVELANSGTPNNCDVTGNYASNYDGVGIYVLQANTVNVVGNNAVGGTTPIWVYDSVNAAVNGNLVSGGSGSGIAVHSTAANSSTNIRMTGNTSNSNGQFGYAIDANTGPVTLWANSGVSNTSGNYSLGNNTTLFDISNTLTTSYAGNLPATATNNNAIAGNLGEYVSATLAIGSAVALTTGTPANITSISLTAGDWDVWINARFTGGGTTTVTRLFGSINTVSATIDSTPGKISSQFYNGATVFASAVADIGVGPIRLSLASTTTVYFVAQGDFAGTSPSCSCYGAIQARRKR